MPTFSTVIMGLYPTVMHSSLRLAPVQMERQRGKGTGCHNLASHSGQEPQLQTHTHTLGKAGQSTHACINPHECFHLQKSRHAWHIYCTHLHYPETHTIANMCLQYSYTADATFTMKTHQQNRPRYTLTLHFFAHETHFIKIVLAVITPLLRCLTGGESKGGDGFGGGRGVGGGEAALRCIFSQSRRAEMCERILSLKSNNVIPPCSDLLRGGSLIIRFCKIKFSNSSFFSIQVKMLTTEKNAAAASALVVMTAREGYCRFKNKKFKFKVTKLCDFFLSRKETCPHFA